MGGLNNPCPGAENVHPVIVIKKLNVKERQRVNLCARTPITITEGCMIYKTMLPEKKRAKFLLFTG